jgi:hypothetical protein
MFLAKQTSGLALAAERFGASEIPGHALSRRAFTPVIDCLPDHEECVLSLAWDVFVYLRADSGIRMSPGLPTKLMATAMAMFVPPP